MKKLSNRAGLSRLLKRFLLIIKLTLTLLLLCLVPVTASTYSQNTRLDISLKDGKMADLIKQIEEKSEFFFYYQNEDLRNMNEITVELNHATVMDILDLALQGSKLNYRIVDKYVILRRSGDSFGEDLLASARESAVIQQRTVSGKVTDSGGQLLPGVTIVVKGTTHGAATNPEGEYALTNVPEDATLVFSFVGMQTLEVLVNNRTIIDVVMKEDVIGLEEVVAIGYGTQKKINVIGSIATVSNEDITAAPVSNVANSVSVSAIPSFQISDQVLS